jgi:hypothetical protein
MTLGEAKELERLKWGESVNKRLKLRDEKQAEIDRTINRRAGAWHAERANLIFDFIAEDIEDQIRIRKELIPLCPDLATEYELQQFENRLSGGIEDKFQNALRSFQVMGVRGPASTLSQLPTRKVALVHRIHTSASCSRCRPTRRDDARFPSGRDPLQAHLAHERKATSKGPKHPTSLQGGRPITCFKPRTTIFG